MILSESIQANEGDCFVIFEASPALPLYEFEPEMSLQYSGILRIRMSSTIALIHIDLSPHACLLIRKQTGDSPCVGYFTGRRQGYGIVQRASQASVSGMAVKTRLSEN